MKRLLPLSILLVAAVVGCDDQLNGPGHTADDHSIAIDAGDPAADGVLHGYVFAVDSAFIGSGPHPIADIPVEIYQRLTVPVSQDGDTVRFEEVLRGTVTSGADGRFTVTAIPVGEYAFTQSRLLPPSGRVPKGGG